MNTDLYTIEYIVLDIEFTGLYETIKKINELHQQTDDADEKEFLYQKANELLNRQQEVMQKMEQVEMLKPMNV